MTYAIEQYKAMLSKERGPALANLYKVSIPYADTLGASNEYLNLLCKGTSLPGRQITTVDRTMGLTTSKIAVGYTVQNLQLKFHLNNSYALRKFFVAWQNKILNYENQTVGYYDDYAMHDVEVMQLRRGESFPVISAKVGSGIKLPAIVRDALPTVGASGNFSGVDLGELSEGNLNLGLVSDQQAIYKVKLQRCYPVTISEIDFDDEPGAGVSNFTVELAYENWVEEDVDAKKSIADKVVDAVNDTVGAVTGVIFG